MATTSELILRFTGDPRQLRQVMGQLRAELSQFSQGQVVSTQNVARQAQQSEQRRVADTIRAANQRLREEQRAAREVARITAQTARQAAQQERLRERAAKQLADVRVREAKRAAKEVERSIAASRKGGGDIEGGGLTALFSVAGRVPQISGLTSELSSLTSATNAAGAAQASLAGPIGIAVAAAVLEITAVIKLSEGLFNLAKQTADFEGRLFDMSQQVGVSVETLSTLEVLAANTGGSIETVAASLAIFQRNLEDAKDPTSEEAKLLAQLGVTATETEEALAQTLEGLFRLGEGSRQTAASMQLFGRSGRFINAILKESGGDLRRAQEEFAKLGIVVGTQNAKAADQFNDSLTTLQFQLRGLTAVIGNEIIPVLTTGFKQVQRIVTENKEGFQALGFAAKGLTVLIGAPLLGAIQTLGFAWKVHQPIVEAVVGVYDRLRATLQLVTGSLPKVDPNAIPIQQLGEQAKTGLELLKQIDAIFKAGGLPLQEKQDFSKIKELILPDPEKLAAEMAAAQNRIRELARQNTLEQLAAEEADIKRSLERRTITFSDYYAQIFQLESARNLRTISSIELERQAAERLSGALERQVAAREIRNKFAAEERRHKEALAKLDDERLNRELVLQQSLDAFTDQQREQLRQLRDGVKSATDQTNDFIIAFLKAGGSIDEATLKMLRFNAQLIDSANNVRIMLELMRETADAVPGPNEGRQVPENIPVPPINIGVPPDAEDSVLSLTEAFDRLGESVAGAVGLVGEFGEQVGQEIGGLLSGAFATLAQGIGEVIHNYVLLGETGPAALRKVLAVALASLAAESAVKAVYYTAQGIADLFFNPARAASSFTAAALFASIAGVATLAGRAVAGNLFKQPESETGSRGGGGSFDRNRERDPIDLVRQQQRQELHIFLHGEPGPRFRESILSTVVDSVQSNGTMRTVIKQVAEG